MDNLSSRIDDIVTAIDEVKDVVVGIELMATALGNRRQMNAVSTIAVQAEQALEEASDQLHAVCGELRDVESAHRPVMTVSTAFAEAYATYRAEVDAYNVSEEDGDVGPIEQRFLDAVVQPARLTGNAEAAILLREVIRSDSIGDTFDEKLVRAVLAFLEGGTA